MECAARQRRPVWSSHLSESLIEPEELLSRSALYILRLERRAARRGRATRPAAAACAAEPCSQAAASRRGFPWQLSVAACGRQCSAGCCATLTATLTALQQQVAAIAGTQQTEQASLTALQQQVAGIAGTQQAQQATLTAVQTSQLQFQVQLGPIAVLAARAYNRSLGNEDALTPVPDLNGNVPPSFPGTKAACLGLTGPVLTNLLGSYGLQNHDDLESKRLRLHRHIVGN